MEIVGMVRKTKCPHCDGRIEINVDLDPSLAVVIDLMPRVESLSRGETRKLQNALKKMEQKIRIGVDRRKVDEPLRR